MYLIICIFRVKEFDAALAASELDLLNVRKLCFAGIPEGQGRRALAWRLLFNYLPADRSSWKDYLQRQRHTYQQFLGEQ